MVSTRLLALAPLELAGPRPSGAPAPLPACVHEIQPAAIEAVVMRCGVERALELHCYAYGERWRLCLTLFVVVYYSTCDCLVQYILCERYLTSNNTARLILLGLYLCRKTAVFIILDK